MFPPATPSWTTLPGRHFQNELSAPQAQPQHFCQDTGSGCLWQMCLSDLDLSFPDSAVIHPPRASMVPSHSQHLASLQCCCCSARPFLLRRTVIHPGSHKPVGQPPPHPDLGCAHGHGQGEGPDPSEPGLLRPTSCLPLAVSFLTGWFASVQPSGYHLLPSGDPLLLSGRTACRSADHQLLPRAS